MNLANWRTTLWGSLTTAALFITGNPDLISAIIPDEQVTKRIFGIAALITGFVTFLNAKDKQTSGNGTVQAPLKVDQGDGTSKTLPLTIVVALLLPALALTGCGTPVGIAFANFLDSPENQAIVKIGVQAGVDSLIESYGSKIPDGARTQLEAAAIAAGSSLTTGLIYASAQALRTKQGTSQDVSTAALTATATTQAAVPSAVALPIARAVTALNNQGVPADAANEAVAQTLDAVANAKDTSSAVGKAVVLLQSSRGSATHPRRTLYAASY